MAAPRQGGIQVVTKGFKSDENDAVLCNDNIEIKVKHHHRAGTKCSMSLLGIYPLWANVVSAAVQHDMYK